MRLKFFAITAMSLSLVSTSALAQTTSTDTTAGATGSTDMSGMTHDRMPMEWEGEIGDAFYSDTELGTLRSDDEMQTNWEDMSDEDQERVRDFCERFNMDDQASDMGATMGTGTAAPSAAGAATGTAATGTTSTGAATGTDSAAGTGAATGAAGAGASGTTGTATGSGTTTGAGTGEAHHASLRQICDTIDTM